LRVAIADDSGYLASLGKSVGDVQGLAGAGIRGVSAYSASREPGNAPRPPTRPFGPHTAMHVIRDGTIAAFDAKAARSCGRYSIPSLIGDTV
jgi:hypothetical protein